jgi:hypothetical protein
MGGPCQSTRFVASRPVEQPSAARAPRTMVLGISRQFIARSLKARGVRDKTPRAPQGATAGVRGDRPISTPGSAANRNERRNSRRHDGVLDNIETASGGRGGGGRGGRGGAELDPSVAFARSLVKFLTQLVLTRRIVWRPIRAWVPDSQDHIIIALHSSRSFQPSIHSIHLAFPTSQSPHHPARAGWKQNIGLMTKK